MAHTANPGPRELLALIHDIDGTRCDCDRGENYIEVMRWKDGSGSTDDHATSLFRSLLRQHLGSYNVDEIGAAILAEIDAKAAADA